MVTKQEFIAFSREALRGDIEHLVLPTSEESELAHNRIQMLLPAGFARTGAVRIAKSAVASGWSILGIRQVGRTVQLALLVVDETGMNDSAVRIDLCDGLAWHGAGRDPISLAIFRTRAEGASDEIATALAIFLGGLIDRGELREEELSQVRANIDASGLKAFCRANALQISGSEIATGRLDAVGLDRLRAKSAGASGAGLFRWRVRAAWAVLKERLGFDTDSGQVIGFAGMDGSGKTTLLDRFVKALILSQFGEPIQVHLLPDVIPMPHHLLRRKATVSNYTNPYSEPPVRSRLSAILRFGYYLIAFVAARIWCSAKVLRGRTLVFDRSIVDFASDLTRARIPHFELPRWLLKALLPPGLFFYIDAAPETVVARKGELTQHRATHLASRYDATSGKTGIRRLDGNRDAATVFRSFLEALTNESLLKARRWEK